MLIRSDNVKKAAPGEQTLYRLADFFKILGDSTRIKILHALFISELCVCDIASLLKVSPSAVSHQLRTLRQADLVTFRKEGKTVFYSLSDDHVRLIVNQGLQHITE